MARSMARAPASMLARVGQQQQGSSPPSSPVRGTGKGFRPGSTPAPPPLGIPPPPTDGQSHMVMPVTPNGSKVDAARAGTKTTTVEKIELEDFDM